MKLIPDPIGSFTPQPQTNKTRTRRILRGRPVGETKPYMVYLRPAAGADPKILHSNWLCGGVIIHERYILTSAACIEDAKHFYVVSGLSRWYSFQEKGNECIKNGAKKAVWKCVPKCNEEEEEVEENFFHPRRPDYNYYDHRRPKTKRHMMIDPSQLDVHTGRHFLDTRKSHKVVTGGFCENDHGGPLIVGQGKSSVVIGVMSACLTKDITKKCYGPFLFTSVYRYRNLITCAIEKDLG
ncbi:hypothetical protein HF086_017679 [Spodoptera exigua]|uniref:Peptidase S1 domain-containing protein n=1 Tax=Spodoptera exigua TaxID=7107 RepID=A0A922SGW5_SPOEX|nr:hypothetical protein HF086_017679 [Spodoptera exigua]